MPTVAMFVYASFLSSQYGDNSLFGSRNIIQWNLDLTKYSGTREIGSLYRGSAPIHFKKPGWRISFVKPRTSLYRGSLSRGSIVLVSKHHEFQYIARSISAAFSTMDDQ